MRKIEFRGKRIENGEWVYGTPFQAEKRVFIITSLLENIGIGCEEVHPDTVGEYTGLTDKNGTKIFEGDILSVLGSFNQKGMLTNFHVEYVEKKGAFGMLLEAGDFVSVASLFKVRGLETDVVITGTIHDNKDLINSFKKEMEEGEE